MKKSGRSIREPQCRCCTFAVEFKMHHEFQEILHEFRKILHEYFSESVEELKNGRIEVLRPL